MEQKRVAILGSTGSIGVQTLEVLQAQASRFRPVALAARSDVDGLAAQAARHQPQWLVLTDPVAHRRFREAYPRWADRLLPPGEESLCQLCAEAGVDVVVNALVGAVGVRPTLAALEAGKTVALANKETLVAAGALVMEAARKGGRLIPVDSEHSAIFQCLQGSAPGSVSRLWLTASGGPFREATIAELEAVTPEQALRHPNWRMGGKVTVDSATLMNKGLEVIEAHWLFGMPPEAIEVVVHPQSIVHSMVEFCDGSVLAQLGVPDMRLPIQYALSFPERWPAPWPRLNLAELGTLTFKRPDTERFPCLALAYEALRAGGTAPAVLNAANEVAVALFLRGEIPFLGIPELVADVLAEHRPTPAPGLDEVLLADQWARERAHDVARGLARRREQGRVTLVANTNAGRPETVTQRPGLRGETL